MMRIIFTITIIFVILLFSTYVSGASEVIPPYNDWSFTTNADYSNYTFNSTEVAIEVKNGMLTLQTRLNGTIQSGTEMLLQVKGDASPSSVQAGLEVIINNDTLLHIKISHCDTTYHFYASSDYHTGDNIKILIYDIGGNITLHLGKLQFEFPRSGISEGLFLTGVGITVVFIVLSILAAVMYFLKPRKEPRGGDKIKIEGDEDEVIAAIATAIRMYLEGKKFKIIGVKPSPWKYYGRIARMRRLR